MYRREFVTLLGGAAAWPFALRAQQQKVPVVGFLAPTGPTRPPGLIQALRENGFVEGRSVEFDFRSGPSNDMLALATELVRRKVSAIVAGGPTAARAAMAATTTIPIIFGIGEDPVQERLVASLGRPGGNVTGFSNFSNQLVGKRLELLRALVPKATDVGFLANPSNPNIDPDTADVRAAAVGLGLRLQLVTASNETELESAFASIVQQQVGALLVGVDPWFRDRREQIAALAARRGVPASYERRDFAIAGGLMSYGTEDNERERQMGIYIALILKGAKPANLPVLQSTKVELVINLKAAQALGLTVPPTLRALADEVIE